jgi:hypothetical protein
MEYTLKYHQQCMTEDQVTNSSLKQQNVSFRAIARVMQRSAIHYRNVQSAQATSITSPTETVCRWYINWQRPDFPVATLVTVTDCSGIGASLSQNP